MAAPLPDFSMIIAGVSAAMQAIQTWVAVRDRNQAAEVYDDTFEEALSDIKIAEESSLLVAVVPMHILIVLASRTDDCFNRYSVMLKSEEEFLPSEIDEATLAVKKCVCRDLKIIYELNGSIPAGKLQQWWELYHCKNMKDDLDSSSQLNASTS
jgi:hypothetical protein